MITRMRRSDRSEQLVGVAAALFAEAGFHGVSMNEVAQRAGVSKPVLYDHFGSKEGLFAACTRRSAAVLAAEVAAAAQGRTDPRDQLEAGSLAFFRFVRDQQAAWAVLFDEARTGPLAAEATRIRQQQSGLMVALMAASAADEGIEADRRQIEALAHALAGAYEALAVWWRNHPEIGPEEITAWFLELAWPGLEGQLVARRTRPSSSRR